VIFANLATHFQFNVRRLGSVCVSQVWSVLCDFTHVDHLYMERVDRVLIVSMDFALFTALCLAAFISCVVLLLLYIVLRFSQCNIAVSINHFYAAALFFQNARHLPV
jgi:hypothetical protein